jgi:EAL domain-containing protein (putative c-di-GMP-specific phosphodiesterase class I)
LLQDTEAILRTLGELRRLGLRISLDDFGTGYSSLSYLRTIPLTGIKIDRSFIKDLTSTTEARVIIKSISEIAAALGMSTTAEGIETEAQLASVRALGCREAQGFLLGKPAPANEVAELLRSWPVRRYWAAQRSHIKCIPRDGEHAAGTSRVATAEDRVRAIPG